jgi:conjugal transfer/entry exclusion protein
VQSVRADREAAQASAAVAQQAKNKEKTMADRIATLEAENKQLAGQAQAKQLACLEIKRLDSVRAITASVSVPAYCL